jgi:hypothetical protein
MIGLDSTRNRFNSVLPKDALNLTGALRVRSNRVSYIYKFAGARDVIVSVAGGSLFRLYRAAVRTME